MKNVGLLLAFLAITIPCQAKYGGDPLSYCGDYHAAVREFVRVVRAGGTVIASVDNRACALNWIKGQGEAGAIEQLLATGNVVLYYQRS